MSALLFATVANLTLQRDSHQWRTGRAHDLFHYSFDGKVSCLHGAVRACQACATLSEQCKRRMDWTDIHYRQLARLISRHTWLYTEMVVDMTILHSPHTDKCDTLLSPLLPAYSTLGHHDAVECQQPVADWLQQLSLHA